MTQVMEGFQTFVSSGTYTISTDEPEAQYLTSAMLNEYVQAISSATSSPSVIGSHYFEASGGYQYQQQEEVWPSFDPHEYWQPASEIRENEEPPFPTGRRAWEEVERPIPRDTTPRDVYPPLRHRGTEGPSRPHISREQVDRPMEEEGPGIESISMIGFR